MKIFQAETLKAGGGEEHGALVQQILETQKELEEPKKKTLGGVEIVSNYDNVWTETSLLILLYEYLNSINSAVLIAPY